MKSFSIILSLLCLLLIGALFYLFLNHTDQIKKLAIKADKPTPSNFRVAYFDIDSLEAHYNYFKDAQSQVKAKENAMNAELNSMEKVTRRRSPNGSKRAIQ